MDKRKVFLYETDRSLLLFMLYTENLTGRNMYISSEGVNPSIWNRLVGLKILLNNKILSKSNNRWYNSFLKRKRKYMLKKLIRMLDKDTFEVYGLAHVTLGNQIFSTCKLNLMEDGLRDISMIGIHNKEDCPKFIETSRSNTFTRDKMVDRYGYDPNIKKIIITTAMLKKCNTKLSYCIEELNIESAWKKKSDVEREYILGVFGVNLIELQRINNYTWLYTQPLSEDNLISEEEKVNLYARILANYPRDNILLKPHPREHTDYSKVFSNIRILKQQYPIEIFTLLGIRPKKAVTIFSTAVFNIGEDIPVDFYGTEIHSALFTYFGSMDKIFKRNAFIK